MNRSLMNVVRGALGLATIVFGLAACGPEYDRTEITGVRRSTYNGDVSTNKLTVPVGLAVTAQIVIWNDDNEQMSINVRSMNTDCIEVTGVVNERNYMFTGKQKCETAIEFSADGERVLTIPATVTEQPEFPE